MLKSNEIVKARHLDRKVYLFVTAGCEILRNDVARLEKYLQLNKWQITDDLAGADLAVVSGCGYSLEREEIFFERFAKLNGISSNRKEIIVYGCISGIAAKRLKNEFGGRIFGPRENKKLDAFLCAEVPLSQVWAYHLFGDDSDAYNLPVGIGCMGKCSFCAIHFARGKIQSVPLEIIEQRFQAGLAAGHQKFSLIGDDVACYGVDIGSSFPHLITAIFSNPQNFSLNIGYLDPYWLLKYFPEIKDRLADNRLDSVLIPIQSGSQRILKLMNREYHVPAVLEVVREIKAMNPNILIRTHIMCGFPSETFEEWQDSVEAATYFDVILAGKYWDRPRTKASQMPNRISESEAMTRLEYLEKSLTDFENVNSFVTRDRPRDVKILCRRAIPDNN